MCSGIQFEFLPFIVAAWTHPKHADIFPHKVEPDRPIKTPHPVIGVLSQEIKFTKSLFAGNFLVNDTKTMNTEFFDSTYVKFLEQAGARVVPIYANGDQEYYEKMFNLTNGILLPGGSALYGVSSKYAF